MKHILCRLAGAVALACWAAGVAGAAEPAAMPSQQLAVGDKPYAVQMATLGAGRYTVIFESGFGTDLRAWRKVMPEVATTTRAVAYSRAGHGSSDARPEARTIAQNTAELEQLVSSAKLVPPFILVGHSYGGLLVRSYAARHPEQVAGMVFVDPSDERLNPALRALDAERAAADERAFAGYVPPKFQPELALLQPVLDSGKLPLAGKLPDVPVVVLTSTQAAPEPMFFVETKEAIAIKRGLHADFLRQFSEGSQVLTEKSGHNIQLEEPELVTAAIRKVIAAAERRAAAPVTGTAGGTPRTAP